MVIIGKTNVGKSTLFNKLTKKNFALIHNIDHTTRDRKYGNLIIDNINLNVIDTAGIEQYKKNNVLKNKIMHQTYQAINESHLVLFMINIQNHVTYEDMIFISQIQKKSKKIFLVINKIDSIRNYSYISHEFYNLGIKDIFFISAFKNIGIHDLKNKIKTWIECNVNSKLLTQQTNIYNTNILSDNNNTQEKKIIVAIVGKPNVGKSTLLNSLIDQDRMITHHIPGTTRDSITSEFSFLNQKYTIIDTAGINKVNCNQIQSLSVLQTLHAINISDIIILLLDAKETISKQDLWILNTILSSGKILLIFFNKSETLSLQDRKQLKSQLLFNSNTLKFFKIYFISALYKQGIKKIFPLIKITYYNTNKLMKSSQLTKIMYYAINQHPPENTYGKKIKLKYAHPGGYFPPTIIIHGNRISYLSNSYKRYLLNFFQKYLKFQNVSIRIIFKNLKNPYIK